MPREGGNALLVPGKRFSLPVVANIRLKAPRKAQQLIEYLRLLALRYKLQGEQVKALVHRALGFSVRARSGTALDNADALQFTTLKAWQIASLRR